MEGSLERPISEINTASKKTLSILSSSLSTIVERQPPRACPVSSIIKGNQRGIAPTWTSQAFMIQARRTSEFALSVDDMGQARGPAPILSWQGSLQCETCRSDV